MMEFGVLNEIKSKVLSVNEDYLDLEWAFKNVTPSNPITESNSGLQFEKYGEGTLWGVFIGGSTLAYDYGLKVVVDDCTIYDIVKHESEYFDAFNGIGFMTKSILDTYSRATKPENWEPQASHVYLGEVYHLPVPRTGGVPFVHTYYNKYDDGVSIAATKDNRTKVGQTIRKNVSQIVIPSYNVNWKNGSSSAGNYYVRSGSTEVLPMPIKFKNSVKVYGHYRPYNLYNQDVSDAGFAMLTSK